MKYNEINRDIPVFMGFTTLHHAHCISIDEKFSTSAPAMWPVTGVPGRPGLQVVDALRFWHSPRRSAGWLSPV
jgi:hypothetical protein